MTHHFGRFSRCVSIAVYIQYVENKLYVYKGYIRGSLRGDFIYIYQFVKMLHIYSPLYFREKKIISYILQGLQNYNLYWLCFWLLNVLRLCIFWQRLTTGVMSLEKYRNNMKCLSFWKFICRVYYSIRLLKKCPG